MSDPTQPQHGSRISGAHYQPALGVVLATIVLFVAAAFLMLRSTTPSSSAPTTLPTSTTTTTAPHIVDKSRVRVQVANGTTTAGLATVYTQKLLTIGWDTLPPINGPKVVATDVYYRPGYEWAATEIASEIKVNDHDVKPIGSRPVLSSGAGDNVIVLLGPDAPKG